MEYDYGKDEEGKECILVYMPKGQTDPQEIVDLIWKFRCINFNANWYGHTEEEMDEYYH